MKIVSLFSGIGGFDLGFLQNNFEVIWANDFDKYAVQTYKENISSNIVFGDILDLKKEIPPHDIILAGFPCQPFSTLGKQQGFNDERGTLFYEILDIAKKHKTKILVLENVKNLMLHDKKQTFNKMLELLDKAGYNSFYEVLNAKDFGIPQQRARVFIVAILRKFTKEHFEFPIGVNLENSTQDLLDETVKKEYFLTKKIAKTILSWGSGGYKAKPTIDRKISKTLTATMHKMHRASQDNYITDEKNFKNFDDENRINIRKLTPNECRKLQGFPNNWKQIVSDTQAYKQFGNAVCVNVSNALAKKLKEYLEKQNKF